MNIYVFGLEVFKEVTAVEYMYVLPSIEFLVVNLSTLKVLVVNLITLNYCFKRKYSVFKTILAFFAFTAFLVMPIVLYKNDLFNGNGRFTIFGFLYIIPLKFLYDEKLDRLFLNMCMSWTYTL